MSPARPGGRPGGGAPVAGTACLRLSPLARVPGPEVRQALEAAALAALGLPATPLASSTSPWRLAGRWWVGPQSARS